MTAEPPVSSTAPGSPASPERVAAAIERVRAGVLQRRAEIATLDEAGAASAALIDLAASEYLREPQPVSPRPLVGGWLVFLRKAMYHVVFKWWGRPVVEQQNRFNRAAAELLREQAEAAERRERRLRDLESRVQVLERQGGETPPA
jgi:hypothetical protein